MVSGAGHCLILIGSLVVLVVFVRPKDTKIVAMYVGYCGLEVGHLPGDSGIEWFGCLGREFFVGVVVLG